MKRTALILITIAMTMVVNNSCTVTDSDPSSKPNIVLINADDLGYGDLGCYGATKLLC